MRKKLRSYIPFIDGKFVRAARNDWKLMRQHYNIVTGKFPYYY
jgi:hypothetical protein